MPHTNAMRVAHEAVLTISALPEAVFPLLCPVREAEWVPGWQYRLVYSQSGVAELGCVFTTPNDDGSETVWIVTGYVPPERIEFAWVWPERIATRLEIALAPAPGHMTSVTLRYTYTSLSPTGDDILRRYDEAWFAEKMHRFEEALNRYLQTGRKAEQAWE